MKTKFRFVKGPTSDVKFVAYGKDAKELFENAALAVSSVICEIGKVKPRRAAEASVEGKDLQDLLFNWLNYVVALVDTECMFFSSFSIEKMTGTVLNAKCYGDDAKPENSLTVVKAVTYHEFSLEKAKEGYKATIVLDI